MQDRCVMGNRIELQIRDYYHEGEAILFLHFSGANMMMWQKAIPYFQDDYRLILVDLRGHGKSDKPETGYHMDEMACDVAGLMQNLDLQRAHIIGSSLGAEVGLSLAANYPGKVISLVCDGALSSEYGPYGTWEGSEAEFQEFVNQQLEKLRNSPETIYASVDELVERSRKSLEEIGWWNEYVEAMERYGASRLDDGRYTKSFKKCSKIDYLSHYFYYRLEDYYKKVRCPILMLPGEDLLKNPPEKMAMEGLRNLTPKAQIVEVNGWEHPYGWLLNPENMCKEVWTFLDSIPSLVSNR